MNPRDFLIVASTLADKDSPTAAELRTAVSRGYYALYNVAVEFVGKCRVKVLDNQEGHRAVPKALRACGDNNLRDVAAVLDALRTARWEADYSMTANAPEHQKTVKKHAAHAKHAVRLLDGCEQDDKLFSNVKASLRSWAASVRDFRVD